MRMVEEGRGTLSAEEILTILPHRHPFALLDKVIELEPGRRGVALKNVTISDPCFAGHFPSRPIYPGILLIECLAQLTAVVYGTAALHKETGWVPGIPLDGAIADKVGYIAAIRSLKFLRLVRPGDQVRLVVEMGGRLGKLMDVSVEASAAGEPVLRGKLAVSERQKDVKEGVGDDDQPHV
jgi:3-hydroxyacyl-[acyl-carrier-protein] dehydratase